MSTGLNTKPTIMASGSRLFERANRHLADAVAAGELGCAGGVR